MPQQTMGYAQNVERGIKFGGLALLASSCFMGLSNNGAGVVRRQAYKSYDEVHTETIDDYSFAIRVTDIGI